VLQHEEFDVLGGGRASQQQDQPEHLLEGQIQQAHNMLAIMPGCRMSSITAVQRQCPTSGTPQVPEPVHGRIRRRPILGGLLNEYETAA
jgi:hypothetical protein